MYTYINGYIHLRRQDAAPKMSRRTQVTLTDRQHAFLRDEAGRTGLSMAELVRRAVDSTYRPLTRPRVPGIEVTFGVWPHPDEAVVGRRPPALRRLLTSTLKR